jgi:hypothetical protein
MDLNMAVETEEEGKLLEQLPKEVQISIFSQFLFSRFLFQFKNLLIFKKLNSKHKHAYYHLGDELYMNFIMQFLRILEPISYKPGQIIYNELDNIDIIIFFNDGNIDVGYEINREIKYKLRFSGVIQIGGFECTHNRRCQVIYKS